MKIKVLHTEWSDGWGGQEIRIINEMLAVRRQGVDVSLACRPHAQIKLAAESHGIKVHVLPFRGNTDIATLFSLVNIIRQNNISIVNTHSGKDTWVGGLAAKLAGAKFIRTRHLSNRIKSSRLNFINELCDYVFTTGESVRKDMIEHNRIQPGKIASVPSGIDEKLFNPDSYDKIESRASLNLPQSDILIGIVAVLRGFKRHDLFLLAAKALIQDNPELRLTFVIAGEGPTRPTIESQIQSLGLESSVIMLGHVDNVPQLLSALDIFVLSSDSKEGVPQSIMQALLMGLPVVATEAGSTSDLHINNNFMLTPVDDATALTQNIGSLLHDPLFVKKIARDARASIIKRFTQTNMVNQILNIYSRLCANADAS